MAPISFVNVHHGSCGMNVCKQDVCHVLNHSQLGECTHLSDTLNVIGKDEKDMIEAFTRPW